MTAHESLAALIDMFHDAALEPGLWQRALTRLGEAVGGSGVVVVTAYDAVGGAHLLESVGYDPEYWQRVQAEHSTPETNRYIRLINAATPGQVLQPRTSMSLGDWLDDPIYRKFLRPDGLGDGLTCPLFHRQGGFAAVATFRRQHYDQEHVQMLQAVAPHIRHALNVHLRLGGHADDAGAGRAALDSIRAGIILTDAHARTIQVNTAAQRLLDRADGFVIGRGGSLVAASRDATNRLHGLIRSAGKPDPRGQSPGGGSMRLPRLSGMAPLEVLVSPLRATPFAGSFSLGARASVMLCVVDPDAGVEIEAAGLRQLYGLTAAEARLALMLLAGHDLPAAALALGISVHTARTLLKRSFERVGVHRQTDFVARVLAGPFGTVIRSD